MRVKQLFKTIKENLGEYTVKYFLASSIEQLFTVICLNIVIAYAAQYAVKAAAVHDIKYLYVALLVIGGAMLAAFLVIPFTGYLSSKFVKKAIANMKVCFYQHYIKLTKEAESKKHAGEIMALFTDDLKQVEELYYDKIKKLLSVVFVGPISITALFQMNWILGGLVLLLGVFTLTFIKFEAKINKNVNEILQGEKSKESSRLMDLLGGLEATKTMGISRITHSKFEMECAAVEKTTCKRATVEAVITMFSGFMYYFRELIVLAAGFLLMREGILTIDEIIASAFLVVNAGYMFDNIGVVYTEVQKSIVSVNRYNAFMAIQEESMVDGNKDEEFTNLSVKPGESIIDFKEVSFAYREQEPVLDKINMSICSGEYIGIVGPSGSGKSTIIKLLLKFYEISEGMLKIKGTDIHHISNRTVRRAIAYIPQEHFLFPGTIKENILYGDENASMEEVIQASRKALCDEFIMKLPQGYDTVVGNENNFSGGQIQRIIIARALLKNAPILLLDEPTVALDADSESQVLETLKQLKGKVTIIVITHKLYTLTSCDKVFSMERGKQ